MKSKYLFCLFLSLTGVFASRVFGQNPGESLESVVKRAIGQGIMRREGTRLIYMASPAQDTGKIRNYYEGLIKSSGSAFSFQFDKPAQVNQKVIPENTPVVHVVQNPVNQVNTNIRQTVIDQRSVCFARQAVYGVLHYTDNTEHYTWVVPEGVTQIRIEAWSGGGNGYGKFNYNPNDSHEILDITGGGGGGGAYASAMLPVQAGEKIIITIPPGGGGKAVEVLLNDKTNALYLNNGADGNAEDALKGKGYGGVSGGNYGRFTTNNVFWTSGQNGGTLTNAYYHYEAPKQVLGQSSAGVNDINIENFGNGGSAANLNNGSRGAQLHNTSFGHYSAGQNGGFPGGGGGGGELGINTYGGWYGPGKGAPGLVIVHF